MNYQFLLLFIIMSIINIIASEKNKTIIIILSKITLAPLAFLNFITNTHFPPIITTLATIAYLFYLLGDIFLLSEKKLLFQIGLLNFLFGHITFTALFIQFSKTYLILPIALLILIYPERKIFMLTSKANDLKIPMRIYSIFLLFFIAFSTTTLNIVLIIATILFTISDSMIAKNSCLKTRIHSHTQIMSTYTSALILLSIALIMFN